MPTEQLQVKAYLAAGYKLMPSGRINSYIWARHQGRLGSRKDHTWMRDPKDHAKGHHSCCGSKRDYYHKISCAAASSMAEDDLSDLKEVKDL